MKRKRKMFGLTVRLSSLEKRNAAAAQYAKFYNSTELLLLHTNVCHLRNQSIRNSFNMPPKKKVERAATENISLGPQVREGEPFTYPTFQNANEPVP